jgi:hypothetical protein
MESDTRPGQADAHAFLVDCFFALKQKHPGISHRYISARLGLRSPAVFCHILNGKFHPSPRTIDRLALLFELTPALRNRLALLLEARRVKDPFVRAMMRDWASAPPTRLFGSASSLGPRWPLPGS